jgi:hypothetical protein
VLAVAVLRALAAEGAHAAAVAAQLDASDVWAAYRGQRHDLFLPAGAGAKARPTRAPRAARGAHAPASKRTDLCGARAAAAASILGLCAAHDVRDRGCVMFAAVQAGGSHIPSHTAESPPALIDDPMSRR